MPSCLIKNKFDKSILRYNCVENAFCRLLCYNLVNNIGNLLLLLLVLLYNYICKLYVMYNFFFLPAR